MQKARYDLFPRSVRSRDQNARVGGRGQHDLALELHDRTRHPRQERFLLLALGLEPLGQAGPRKRVVHRDQHALERQGLVQEVDGALAQRPHRLLGPGVAGDHHHRHGVPGGPHPPERLDPVHPRQRDIEQDEVVELPCDRFDRLLAGPHGGDREALVAQDPAELLENPALVVHDQDVRVAHGWPPGRRTTASTPCGRLASSRTVPPWSVTIRCTIARPTPEPLPFVE